MFLLLLLNSSFVQAGFFDGEWGEWLSGYTVQTNRNKDFELVYIDWNALEDEVLAKVCNKGTIAVNFNNKHFASFIVDGLPSDWVYPQSYGYQDSADVRRISSSTLYIDECMVLAHAVSAQPSVVTVRVDPEDYYLESDENNNERTVEFEEPVLSVLLDTEAEINNGEGNALVAEQVQDVPGFFIVVLLVFVSVVLFFFLRQAKRVNKKTFTKF